MSRFRRKGDPERGTAFVASAKAWESSPADVSEGLAPLMRRIRTSAPFKGSLLPYLNFFQPDRPHLTVKGMLRGAACTAARQLSLRLPKLMHATASVLRPEAATKAGMRGWRWQSQSSKSLRSSPGRDELRR